MRSVTKARVSIVTPVYNGEKYIARCIDSVLAQSYPHWEMIVVDDGSTDRTAEIVRSYDDPRIRFLRLPHRGLPALAETYNAALSEARGELIAVLEGDDEWPVDKLSLQVPVFDDPIVMLSWGRSIVVDGDGRRQRYWRVPGDFRRDVTLPELFRVLTRWNIISPAVSVVVRKSALQKFGGFRQTGSALYVDLPTWLRVAAYNDGVARYMHEEVGVYRMHGSNAGAINIAQLRLEAGQVALDVLSELSPERLAALGWTPAEEKKTRAHIAYSAGVAYLAKRSFREARSSFTSALRGTRSPKEALLSTLGYCSSLLHLDLIDAAYRARFFVESLPVKLAVLALLFVLSACTKDVSAPVAAGTRTYKSVSSGGDHACAVSEAGDAYCWGTGVHGELGNGAKGVAPTPALVTGGLKFNSISAGATHTCALATDGRIFCWGWNVYFQRGNAFDNRDSEPVPITGTLRFTAVSAGGYHSCGLGVDSLAYCWGNNRYGQIGDATTNMPIAPQAVAGNIKFTQISSGTWHTCGVTRIGAIYCWGSNVTGQLGIASGILFSTSPSAVSSTVTFLAVSAGQSHTCAVSITSEFYCWGSNEFGELGNGAAVNEAVTAAAAPTRVLAQQKARVFAAGAGRTCAVDVDGNMRCFGSIAPSTAFSGVTQFAIGSPTLGCLLSGGAVYCWSAPGSEPQRIAD